MLNSTLLEQGAYPRAAATVSHHSPVDMCEHPVPDLGQVVKHIASRPVVGRTVQEKRDFYRVLLRTVEFVRSEDLRKVAVHSVKFLPDDDNPTSVRFSVFDGKTARPHERV